MSGRWGPNCTGPKCDNRDVRGATGPRGLTEPHDTNMLQHWEKQRPIRPNTGLPDRLRYSSRSSVISSGVIAPVILSDLSTCISYTSVQLKLPLGSRTGAIGRRTHTSVVSCFRFAALEAATYAWKQRNNSR